MTVRHSVILTALLWGAAGLIAAPASAGSKYQASLVPVIEGNKPGFRADGSDLRIDEHKKVKAKLHEVVDAAGNKVTTDGHPSADDYVLEIDLSVPATGQSTTAVIPFDLHDGHADIKTDLKNNAVFTGAAKRDGVAVTGVRVKDASATIIGNAGFELK
jgi:hypothetical protein